MPIFTGQPERNAAELQCEPAQLKPPVSAVEGSEA
jgi:hypothetical protein